MLEERPEPWAGALRQDMSHPWSQSHSQTAGYAQAKGERDGRWPTQFSLSTSSHVFSLFHPTPCWVLGRCADHTPLSHIRPTNLL